MLNSRQKQAVEAVKGQVLILAGAGTGKTKVLVEHVKYLIFNCNVRPENILATTFTIKATQELRQRLIDAQCPVPQWIGTFHSLCMKIIKEHLNPDITIVESGYQQELCHRLFGRQSTQILEQINKWKNSFLYPEDIESYHEYRAEYIMYQKVLQQDQQMDFGDLIMECCNILETNENLRNMYQQQFQYICIDEFQDTNMIQFLWLRLLTTKLNRNTYQHSTSRNQLLDNHIFCVGDDDQAIYGFRGSDNKYILKFRQFYPDCTIIKLEENYRSTSSILQTALAMVEPNNNRLNKTLRAQTINDKSVQLMKFDNNYQEEQWLIDNIFNHSKCGSVGILVRTAKQVTEYNKLLQEQGLIGATGVGMLLAYLQFLSNPTFETFISIVNVPKRGFGPAKIEKLRKILDQKINSHHVPEDSYHVLDDLSLDDRDFSDIDHDVKTASDPLLYLLDCAYSIGKLESIVLLREQCIRWRHLSKPTKINQIWKVIAPEQMLPRYIVNFMDRIETFTLPKIHILTIHASKGLEFDHVYLLGWEDGVFPHILAIKDDVEEERRLAYVAITRGKERVWITYCLNRATAFGISKKSPSSFLRGLKI